MGLLGVSLAAAVGLVLFIVWHRFSFREQLVQAREEERLARQGEQEAVEAERLSRLQAEGQKLFHDAEVAVAARDWPNARLHLTKALATFSAEERFESLKNSARALLEDVEQKLRAQADRQGSQERLVKLARTARRSAVPGYALYGYGSGFESESYPGSGSAGPSGLRHLGGERW